MAEGHIHILGWFSLVLSVLSSLHVLLYKRNARSAIAWIGLIWLSPLLGALLYPLFGINRVRRRAMELRPGSSVSSEGSFSRLNRQQAELESEILDFGRHVTGRPALAGNQVLPLWGGDEAYPQMLEAIRNAKRSVSMCSYIFDRDQAGLEFVEALSAAAARGVQVRVLIDDIGAHYSLWPIDWTLKKKGVRAARFLPVFSMRSVHLMNLRLHRKLLIVDGRTAFTGGMNIRQGNRLSTAPKRAIRDVQFRVQGPVVANLQDVFVEDWGFSTREVLQGEDWYPKEIPPAGKMVCRAVVDGPDSHMETVRLLLQGAVASARKSLLICTPYFLPDPVLTAALNVAALRGVRVQILVPEQNNLPWCHWAMQASIQELVKNGCEVYFAPGDFDHSKLFVVDQTWSLFGSSNWDERSMRLNFELNVECYDPELATHLSRRISERLLLSRRVGLTELESLSFFVRVRDGFARLFLPYL